MTSYLLAIPNAYWYGPGTWTNSMGGTGQPGAGDTATIGAPGQSGTPWVYGAYLNGPTIVINDATASSTEGLAAYNSNLGGLTSILVTNSVGSTDNIILDNSNTYSNLYVQLGAAILTVPTSTYGNNFGLTIVGGITNPTTGVAPATSLTVAASGSFTNWGTMYSFPSATLSYAYSGTVTNGGSIIANTGTVNFNPTGNVTGTLANNKSLLIENNGTMNVNSALMFGASGNVDVDSGSFVLAGATSGTGTLNLVAGQMEFTGPAAMNVAPTVTTEFTGSAFSLVFDGATSVSDLLTPSATPGGADVLNVSANFGTTTATLALTLDTAHTYTSSEFTVAGNHLNFA